MGGIAVAQLVSEIPCGLPAGVGVLGEAPIARTTCYVPNRAPAFNITDSSLFGRFAATVR
ncbi:MAG: hypothetical protein BMS9Abin37_0364 [Acidobacteriota bacterium]|nr:MAG: hypothetical protein BMS9Abin37_0364 [Acidobacteriota bacterium]